MDSSLALFIREASLETYYRKWKFEGVDLHWPKALLKSTFGIGDWEMHNLTAWFAKIYNFHFFILKISAFNWL